MNLTVFLSLPGPTEIILILVALLFLFGGRKIPELMKDLGRGFVNLRKLPRRRNK